jgi:class 3 adenylate cyclase
MFADMAGFTLWSSSRTPVQVFELLETVYKAFDSIAVRRRVFKVETITWPWRAFPIRKKVSPSS